MKLRNKKTGEVVIASINTSCGEIVFRYHPLDNADDINFKKYRSISALNEEWEDYEEPKKYWLISPVDADVEQTEMDGDEVDTFNKQIGNYFETKEEAEKAVEKLKAWKRLKEKGFKFTFVRDGEYVYLQADWGLLLGDFSDVELLFGGEE